MLERSGELTRSRIIAVATTHFSRGGFDKVTIKNVAHELHISEAAVYRYFDTKEALSGAVLTALIDRLKFEAIFRDLASESNVEKLLGTLATHIVGFFSEQHEVYRLLLYSALSGHVLAHRVYNEIRGTYCNFLRAQLDRLYREKRIRKVNNEITARCFTGMVFDCALGYTLWKGMQGKIFDPPQVIANNVSIYAQGLRTRANARRDS